MKKIAKLLSFLLAAVLCFGMLPASALALDAGDEWPDFSNGARPGLDAFDFVEGETLTNFLLATDPLPESFDLRHVQTPGGEVSYVTPVRLQNPYGTCWGYAAIGAAESSLLSSGLAALDGYDENTLDLSESRSLSSRRGISTIRPIRSTARAPISTVFPRRMRTTMATATTPAA